MAICDSNCAVSVPSLDPSCGRTTFNGGINAFGFAGCDQTFDITDPSAWASAIDADTARVITGLLGSIEAPSDKETLMDSCTPPQLTGRTWTIKAKDYNFQETRTVGPPATVTADKILFWNAIQADPTKWRFAFGNCDGYSWGFIDNISVKVGIMVPETNQEKAYLPIEISWQAMDVPVYFLLNLATV